MNKSRLFNRQSNSPALTVWEDGVRAETAGLLVSTIILLNNFSIKLIFGGGKKGSTLLV